MKKLRREICLSMQKLQLRKRLSGRGFWFHENGKLEKVTRKIKPIFLFFFGPVAQSQKGVPSFKPSAPGPFGVANFDLDSNGDKR